MLGRQPGFELRPETQGYVGVFGGRETKRNPVIAEVEILGSVIGIYLAMWGLPFSVLYLLGMLAEARLKRTLSAPEGRVKRAAP